MILQLGERPAAGVVIARPTQAMSCELLLGVAGHRLEQRPLVAALRHPHLHSRPATHRQPLLVGGEVVGLVGHQHLLGHTENRVIAVHRLDDAVDQLARRQLLDLVEDEPLAADNPPPAHVEHLHRRLQFVFGDADHIEVLTAIGHHLLLLDRLAYREQPVAKARSPLEFQVRRSLAHIGFEPVDDLVGVAVEEADQVVDQLLVCRRLDLADTRTGALLDVEQQTGAPETFVLRELGRAARADRKRPQQEVEGVANGVGVGIRAEIAGSLALASSHHQGSGPFVVDGDGEKGVTLVVPQPHVEARTVLLDQRVFEHQRLDLVAHRGPLDRLGGLDHLSGARVQVARRLEVVRQTLPEVRRLADVDHPTMHVLELVRAGRLGDRAGRWTFHHNFTMRGSP